MSFTSVYDANGIGIDNFFYTGDHFNLGWLTWEEVFDTNVVLFRTGANVRMGPDPGVKEYIGSSREFEFVRRESGLFVPSLFRLDDGNAKTLYRDLCLRNALNDTQTYIQTPRGNPMPHVLEGLSEE